MPNYAFTTNNNLPTVENGHTFENLNFSQAEPHTEIFSGITGLTFHGCNLVNCDVPMDATIEGCLHIHKSFCSHLHPKWIDKGIVECDEICSHVVDTDEITIDGVLVDTIYHYKDTLEM